AYMQSEPWPAARLELGPAARTASGGGVVGTHLLANVAAEDPVAEQRSQLRVDRSTVFDRQIGDAALGFEVIRLAQCIGGTGVNAQATRAAILLDGFIELELDVGQERAEEHERADRRGQVGVLA